MANTSYSMTVGQQMNNVTQSTNAVSMAGADFLLVVNTTSSSVTDGEAAGSARVPKKSELLQALDIFKEYIMTNWSGF